MSFGPCGNDWIKFGWNVALQIMQLIMKIGLDCIKIWMLFSFGAIMDLATSH